MNLSINNTNSTLNEHHEMTVLEATQRRLAALPADERLEEIARYIRLLKQDGGGAPPHSALDGQKIQA